MRAIALTAMALLVCAAAGAKVSTVAQFNAFKTKYGRKYATAEEEARRLKIFEQNMAEAQRLMALNPHATFGVNEFADLSPAEFKSRHNAEKFYAAAQKQRAKLEKLVLDPKLGAGQAIDWRTKGAVTGVKNQGDCGSCWAFSTTGGIEGQWFLAGNTLTTLSEQELVSCDTIDAACNGGLMDNAFTWLLQAHNGSIVTEASYPYASGTGQVPACNMQNRVVGAQISSYKDIADSETTMASFVFASGPLSIAVYAQTWQTYTSGIMTNCPSSQIDHGVLIVGFDDNNNPPYWIIKNSWGTSWGEKGYIRVQKGTGQCSIGSYQTTAIVTSHGPRPNPPPSPAGGSFVQKTCTDAQCSNCTQQSFPVGTCISRNHRSYIVHCESNGMLIEEFDVTGCKGTPRLQSQQAGVCAIVFGTFESESFVEQHCTSSPNPPAPTPAPAVPTPAPAGGSFTQKVCQDAACSVGCASHSFPQNTCLNLSGGGTAIATCTSTALVLVIYSSSDCTGPSQSQSMPINQCLQDNTGTYLENICSSSALERALASIPLHRLGGKL